MTGDLTRAEEDRLYEALAFSIRLLAEEEKQIFTNGGESARLAAWREILEKMRPYYRG